MMRSLSQSLALILLFGASVINTQTVSSSASGYAGYTLAVTGDGESAGYETDNTDTSNSSLANPPPDVYLNASVHVGEIDILVQNLSAKINLDAQVLNLLNFNAGVDVSIGRVDLTIQNITAKVLLEARLSNLVTMIDDVLDSIDLNPVIATLGQGLDNVVDETSSAVSSTASSTSGLSSRSYDLAENILYSVNDYSGNTHTNRVLEQDGTIVDQYLDNDGNVHGQKVVGLYSKDMTFTGHELAATVGGQPARRLEYSYAPFHGLNVISAIAIDDATGKVLSAQVLSESFAGGMSTIRES